MPPQPKPPSEVSVFTITARPGVRRDGTSLDNDYFQDAQWVRFQRGRPRKMGGYQLMTDLLAGPVRSLFVDSRAAGNSAHVFSPSGIEKLEFDNNGVGGGVTDRTPSPFTLNANYTWSVASMFRSSGGGTPVLVASATPDLDSIASDATGGVFSGDVTGSGVFSAISDGTGPIAVSGGCCVLQPYLFVYGSNGLIRNSNPNDFTSGTGWTGGTSNTANVAGSKFVKGLPVRGGGNAPAGVFWALDALVRVSFIGGTVVWRYDTVSAATSVLSKNGIIEHDGVYYWAGLDRFFMYNGVVQELPNDMNLNFFYDNLNFTQRQKVHAHKVPRFGEIWWFFPSGSNTECDKAVIFNYRENTWYDAALIRSAAAPAQVFSRPLLAGGDARATFRVTYTPTAGAFAIGQTVTGSVSAAVGTVLRVTSTALNVAVTSGAFVNGETISSGAVTGTVNGVPVNQELNSVWLHEVGVDRVYKQDVQAIEAYFSTSNFQFMTGGPGNMAPNGVNYQTRITRLEPDFLMTGNMSLFVDGMAYAQTGVMDSSEPFVFTPTTPFIDLRQQRRLMSLRFLSNVAGGDFQMGRLFGLVEPGDNRG